MAAEKAAAKEGFVAEWTEEDHLKGIARPETYHMIVETVQPVGYLIMNRDKHDSLELMRLVITDKHKGYGRQTIQAIKKMAFEDLECHRLWLDVRIHNDYAYKMYLDMGFVEEGILRECVKLPQGHVSIRVMSILRSEYEV